MPHQKSITTIVAEAVIFIGMFAIVGHIAANVWDRVCIQSELKQMKTSLTSLKNAVTNIGQAYDTLYTELEGIEQEAQTNPSRSNLQIYLDRAKYPPIDVHTSCDKKKNMRDFFLECRPNSRNITTWTQYLQKSAGVDKHFFDNPRLETVCTCLHKCYDEKQEN